MQQLARLKMTSFALKVPQNWSGPPDQGQYDKAFKPAEKVTTPAMPPLFQPASLNKYHTDTQKMHVDKIGSFIDKTCSAICSAWSQWQSAASIVGIVVAGPVASVGQIVGPPIGPFILAGSPPMSTPMEIKYTTAIVNAINLGWTAFTATVKIPGLPFWPAYAALPTPVAPPMPNLPVPFATLTQVPVSISANTLKAQMIGLLGDPKAPFHQQLFESIATAFEQCYDIWKVSTTVNNVLAVATGGTPVSPLPAAGTATMLPGGLL